MEGFQLPAPSEWWRNDRNTIYANIFFLFPKINMPQGLTYLRSWQNGCHFSGIFKCIFFNKNIRILNKTSLKYVRCGLIEISQHWFRWWLGAARQQAITGTSAGCLEFTDTCMRHPASMSYLITPWCHIYASMNQVSNESGQIMACCLFGAKPLSKPMLGYQSHP